MKGLTNVLGGKEETRDEDGRIVLGNPLQGCQFCGTVEMKYASNGRAVLYHPGAECCTAAIDLQIQSREGEIRALQAQVVAKETALELLRDETRMYDRDSKSTEATKAFYRLERAEAQLNDSRLVIEGRISGDAARGEIGVTVEIRELKIKRRELQA